MLCSSGYKLVGIKISKEGWEYNDVIAGELVDKEYVNVEKNTFGSMELPKLIADDADGEEFTIELIGLCTEICVVSNAYGTTYH